VEAEVVVEEAEEAEVVVAAEGAAESACR